MKLNLLVVEDDPNTMGIFQKILADDYNLIKSANGKEAMKILEEHHIDIVLLDIVLPGADGYTIAKHIKTLKHLSSIKILMISSNPTIENRIKGYESGAHDYILKPFASKELKAKIDNFANLTISELKLKQMNHMLQEEINHRIEDNIKHERMAIIGMNTAEIVHDLNNPLSAIKGTLELIKENKPIKARTLNRLRSALNNIHGMVSSILGATRNTSQNSEQIICINDLIKSEVEMVKLKNKEKRVKFNLDLEDIAPTVAVRSEMSQVLFNLFQNACDAMHDSQERILTIHTWETEEELLISITDTGPGIKKEHHEKIFEPFFTTKKGMSGMDNKPIGTGLGLSSVKKIINQHKGNIKVSSEEGMGTEFLISFPVSLPCVMIHQLKKAG